jgi:cytochrome P450
VNSFESTFKVYAGPILVVVVREPDEIKTLLNSEFCFEKPFMLYSAFFSYGLLTSGGEVNKLHRKTVYPLFSPTNLQNLLPLLNKKVASFLNKFDHHLSLNEIDISKHALDFAFDSMMATLFGVKNLSEEVKAEFLRDVEG